MIVSFRLLSRRWCMCPDSCDAYPVVERHTQGHQPVTNCDRQLLQFTCDILFESQTDTRLSRFSCMSATPEEYVPTISSLPELEKCDFHNPVMSMIYRPTLQETSAVLLFGRGASSLSSEVRIPFCDVKFPSQYIVLSQQRGRLRDAVLEYPGDD